jgi:hypothetical protein
VRFHGCPATSTRACTTFVARVVAQSMGPTIIPSKAFVQCVNAGGAGVDGSRRVLDVDGGASM